MAAKGLDTQSLELILLFFTLRQLALFFCDYLLLLPNVYFTVWTYIYIYLCWCSFQKEVLTLSWFGDEQALTGKQEVTLILLYKLRMANKQKSRESIFLSFSLCLVSYYIVHTIKARIGQAYLCLDWWHATRAVGLELALLPAGSAWGT